MQSKAIRGKVEQIGQLTPYLAEDFTGRWKLYKSLWEVGRKTVLALGLRKSKCRSSGPDVIEILKIWGLNSKLFQRRKLGWRYLGTRAHQAHFGAKMDLVSRSPNFARLDTAEFWPGHASMRSPYRMTFIEAESINKHIRLGSLS